MQHPTFILAVGETGDGPSIIIVKSASQIDSQTKVRKNYLMHILKLLI